jgi:regulator of replication initiation timing
LEQLKRANDLLEKINQVLKQKLEEINQLRLIEDKLCQKLDEKPIEFNTEGREHRIL